MSLAWHEHFAAIHDSDEDIDGHFDAIEDEVGIRVHDCRSGLMFPCASREEAIEKAQAMADRYDCEHPERVPSPTHIRRPPAIWFNPFMPDITRDMRP